MTDRKSLRLSAILLFIGAVLSLVAGIFHPEREVANDHVAAFTEYANSTNWTAVHLGQFIGMAIFIAGLLVLFFALNVHAGTPLWSVRVGAVSAVVAIALYGVLQAVDGVALKQAVDAWVAAPEAEKMARFASAEAIRWLEWAVRSYQSFMLGLSLLLFATAIVSSTQLARPVGYLMGLSGLAYIVQGWVIGSEGFSANNTIPTLLAYVLIFAWIIWLLIIVWRMQEPVRVPTG